MANYSPDLYQQSLNFPSCSGVYLFRDAQEKVLYIGKATFLNDRIKSYFAKEITGRSPGIEIMVERAKTLSYFVTNSEAEAIILEAKLIRQHKPKYNILLRDDKSFALIRIDWSESFPGVYLAREKELENVLEQRKKNRRMSIGQKIDQQEFFGPYLSSYSVKNALGAMRKVWPFRDCVVSKYKKHQNLHAPCLYGSLGLCPSPCVKLGKSQQAGTIDDPNFLDEQTYRKNIEQIRMFLRGEQGQLIKVLEQEMVMASQKEEYELAGAYRDRLNGLRHLQNMAVVRQISENVSGRFGEKRVEEMASDKAYEYVADRDYLFEGYDISNNQGSFAVGAVVSGFVYEGKIKPVQNTTELRERFIWRKAGYRKYRIKMVTGPSDVDMLAEVAKRRFNRFFSASSDLERAKWTLPDMVVIDGGKAQLGVFQTVISNFFEHTDIKQCGFGGGKIVTAPKVSAVAKGVTRKKVDLYGDFFSLTTFSNEVILLLAEILREEAHRFAIGFYRSRHRKEMLK